MSSLRAAATRPMPVGALGDAVVVHGDRGGAFLPADRFDGRPADQAASLFGDLAPSDVGVGLAVAGGQAGPRAQLGRAGEAGGVADLGHEHRSEDRADPGDGLGGPVAGMSAEQVGDQPGEPVDPRVRLSIKASRESTRSR